MGRDHGGGGEFIGGCPTPKQREIKRRGFPLAKASTPAQLIFRRQARDTRRMDAANSILMLVLAVFCARAEVAVQPDFDLEKFSGSWHIMAAVSNCRIFQSMKDSMTTSAAIVKPLPNGDMHLLVGYPVSGECKKMEMLLKKTDQPGHFTNEENDRKDMRVMATDYDTYAFLYTFKEVPGEPASTTLQLLTRVPDVTPEMMEKFKEHYHNIGLTDDLMAVLPKSDTCVKALSA